MNQCFSCGNAFPDDANFCTFCGTSRTKSPARRLSRDLKAGIIYFFSILLFILAIHLIYGEEYDLYAEIITSLVFVVISSVFILRLQRLIQPFLATPVTIRRMLDFSVLAVIAGVIVSVVAGLINTWIYGGIYSEIDIYLTSALPLPNAILFVCIIPAVFEELAFRGFIYKAIEEHSNAETAVTVSSVLFAVLHLSFIGLLWYIPLAFGVGYIRKRYGSLLYCILVHFVYNFTIVLLDFYLLDNV